MANNGDGTRSDDDEYYETDDLTRIHTAIVDNDVAGLRMACAVPNAEVNEKFTDEINASHSGMTPLALAAALDRVELVKVLIDHGGNVNATFANLETTSLMTSSFHGHTDVVRTLLESGANARAIDLQGSTALGYCFGGSRTLEVVNLLIKAGVDVNQKNILGMNALLLVSGYGNEELIRAVLSAGAHPNAINDFGHSPLHLAVVGKRSQIGMVVAAHGTTPLYGLNRRNLPQTLKDWANGHADLLGGGRIDDKELEKIGNFMMSIGEKLGPDQDLLTTDDQEAVKRKLDAVLSHRQETMHDAKSSKKLGVVDTLLSCGGRRSKKAKAVSSGSAPLDRPGLAPVVSSGSSDEDKKVKDLTDNFARIVRILLDAKCDVAIPEKTFGMTALDMAILMGDVESTVLLTAGGGDSDHLMKLFALSDLYGHIVTNPDKKRVKELIDSDTYLDVNGFFSNFNVTKKTEEDLEQEEKDGFSRGDDGQTPLAVASRVKDNSTVDIIKMLKKNHADVNLVGPGGRCPLGEAARVGNVKMATFLVAQGANIEQQNPGFKNATPVMVAVICNQTKVVEYLIGEGAKVDLPMSDGRTALDKAWEASEMPMIDTLLQNSHLNKNFSDPKGLTYKMAEKYDQPTRDIESILKEIANNVKTLEEKDKKEADAAAEKVRQEAEAYTAKLNQLSQQRRTARAPEASVRSSSQQKQPQQQKQPPVQRREDVNGGHEEPDGNAHRKHQPQAAATITMSKSKASNSNQAVPLQVQAKPKQAPQQRPPSSEESSAEEESESEMDIPEPPVDSDPSKKVSAVQGVQQPVVPGRPRKEETNDVRVERMITATSVTTPSGVRPQVEPLRTAPLLSALPPPPPTSAAPLANKDNDDESFSEEEDEEEEEEESEEESEEEEEPQLQLARTTKSATINVPSQVTSSTVRVIKNANGTMNTVTSTKTVTRTLVATSAVVPSVNQAQIVQSNNKQESEESEEEEEDEEESEEGSEEEEEEEGEDVQDVNSNMAKVRVGQRAIVLNRSAETDI